MPVTDTPQNSRSQSFRELRLAAGYEPTQLAKDLNTSRQTILQWDHGHRPQWQYMPSVAQYFGIDLAEALKLIWKETVGDHCDCCGGEKIFPDKPRAIHPPVKRTCRCGISRIYRTNQHSKGCTRCGLGENLIPQVYRLYGARVSSFAKTCRREIKIRKTRLKYYSGSDDENQPPFFNEAEGTYRCIRCAGAVRMIKNIETQVKKFWVSANPHQTFPKIQSLKQLREVRRAC
jgi:DNA-binding XRE family transcriptional regulator